MQLTIIFSNVIVIAQPHTSQFYHANNGHYTFHYIVTLCDHRQNDNPNSQCIDSLELQYKLIFLCSDSKYEITSVPQSGVKATEQKLPRLSSDYAEPPVSSSDADDGGPIYEDVDASAQQSKDVPARVVKMIDNPAYNTSVL